MVIRFALLAVLVAGCYRDRYTCERDSQCDIEGGRCEIDKLCTGFDETCPTQRSYQHAGELTGLCFDDSRVPANLCAGGQSAAKREGPCLEAVCARLPMCCDLAWTDACVQVAQQESFCDLACDTRIAIGATKQQVTELWDLRWVGDHFEPPTKVTELTTLLQWVAPAPGEVEPRLAGVRDNTTIVVGAHELPFDPLRVYQTIGTIPFSRDGRDTIAVSSQLDTEFTLEIFEPAIEEHRTFVVPGGVALSWGDIDHKDGFIDAVVRKGGQNSNQYSYLLNLDGDDHLRQLVDKATGGLGGGPTPGGVAVRQTDWLDLDSDANLDLAVFGSQVALHHNEAGLRDMPEELLDCSPPVVGGCAATADEPDLEGASFAGCALPDPATPSVIFATFPDRKLFRSDGGAPTPIEFPGDTCACVRNCDPDPCTATDCTCTYNCTACVPILAVIARDLDDDHQLDLIAIDARLTVFHAFAPDFVWSDPTPIPTSLPGNLTQIFTSVSGAPR